MHVYILFIYFNVLHIHVCPQSCFNIIFYAIPYCIVLLPEAPPFSLSGVKIKNMLSKFKNMFYSDRIICLYIFASFWVI